MINTLVVTYIVDDHGNRYAATMTTELTDEQCAAVVADANALDMNPVELLTGGLLNLINTVVENHQ